MKAILRALALVLIGLGLVVTVPPGPVSADAKTVQIRTVPPLAGVEIELDGETTRTGPDGTATFETEAFRNAGERLVVVDDRVELPTGDGYYEHSRTFGKSLDLALAFDLHREVSFRFVTLQGRELTVDEIDTLQLKNSLGGRFEDVDRTAPVLLHANRVVSSPTGPVVRDIVWSIDSVMVGTSNVVNRSEVRFMPATENEIVVTTLFFDATFTVEDLFFGFSTGDTLLVEDPNGVVTPYPLVDGALALDDLPRGDYRVTVVGPGLKLSRPVALSRNQDVDLALLSYLDLTVAAVGLLVFASGTFIAGWRRRKRRLAQRHRDSPADRVPPDLIEALADEPRSEEPAVDGPAVQWSRAERRPVPAAADRPEPGPLREPVARSSPHPAPATAWRQRIVHTRLVVVARREHARMIEAVRRRTDRIRAEGTMGSGPLGYLDELRSAASRLGADTRRGEDRPDPAGELVGVARSLGTDTSDSATPGDGAQ